MNTVTIFLEAPIEFSSKIKSVGCFLHWEDRILLVQRSSQCPEPYTWCLPGGKMDGHESPKQAISREILEELTLPILPDHFFYVKTFYKQAATPITFHTFRFTFTQKPLIKIQHENINFSWEKYEEALKKPLISGGKEILSYYFSLLQK